MPSFFLLDDPPSIAGGRRRSLRMQKRVEWRFWSSSLSWKNCLAGNNKWLIRGWDSILQRNMNPLLLSNVFGTRSKMTCHKVSTNDNNDIAIYGLQISKSNSIMNLTGRIRGKLFPVTVFQRLGKESSTVRSHRNHHVFSLTAWNARPCVKANIFIGRNIHWLRVPSASFAAILASYPILASAKNIIMYWQNTVSSIFWYSKTAHASSICLCSHF